MTHSFIWAAFLIYSLWNFRLFYNIKGFERGYLGLYKGTAMASVICFDASGRSIVPYFSKTIFQRELNGYLSENIKPYVNSYSYTCEWHRVAPYPPTPADFNEVKVDFTFSLMLVGDVSRQLTYTIKESPYE